MLLTILWQTMLFMLIGYFFGTLNFSMIVGKAKQIEIEKTGSGNLGATNAMRTLGVKAGIFIFIGDMLKVFVAFLIMVLLKKETIQFGLISFGLLSVVLGHCFPVHNFFHGGKGVASGFATIICINWIIAIIAISVFILIVIKTKYISLGSVFGVATGGILALFPWLFMPQLLNVSNESESINLFYHGFYQEMGSFPLLIDNTGTWFINDKNSTLEYNEIITLIPAMQICLILGSSLIIWKHVPNIKRLLDKRELKTKH